jgi:iron complex transport system substrate-binding protein
MKKKTLVLIGIAICTMLLTSPVLASAGYSKIYGNANEDDVLDMRDVTYIKLVIFGKKPATTFADANYDGKVSMLDVGQTKLIILGKEKQLTLVDMADRVVTVPKPPERVVQMSQSFIAQVMAVFGVQDRMVGYGACSKYADCTTVYKIKDGIEYEHTGPPYTAMVLHPEMYELPWVGSVDNGINYESLASCNPDLVIIRITCCNSEDNVKRTTEVIESLGFPVVVTRGPAWGHPDPSMEVIYEEIEVLGEVFDKQEKAQELIDCLDAEVEFIKERTCDVPEDEKPKVLYFGLSRFARQKGGVGNTNGIDTIESIFLEAIVNAKNAFRGTGRQIVSAEEVLAMNPDVIMLPTSYGYHPPGELYEDEAFEQIREIKAIQERRVASLPRTWCRSERLETPIVLMIEAKCAYPGRFSDVNVGEWVDKFYKKIYDVDDSTVEELKKAQLLMWLDEEGF